MIKWTTPTLKCTIPNDIELDYLLLTIKQSNIYIEKKIESDEVKNGVFSVFFTQEETGKLMSNAVVEVQLNIVKGETRLATKIVKLSVDNNLHDKLINESM